MEERVLTRFEAAPFTSTRAVAYEMGISQPLVWRIIHEEHMRYTHAVYTRNHAQQLQSLQTDDYHYRV